MKIVISPAKSIDFKRVENSTIETIPSFLKETETLVVKLKKLSSKKIAKMMHLSSDLHFNYTIYTRTFKRHKIHYK